MFDPKSRLMPVDAEGGGHSIDALIDFADRSPPQSIAARAAARERRLTRTTVSALDGWRFVALAALVLAVANAALSAIVWLSITT